MQSTGGTASAQFRIMVYTTRTTSFTVCTYTILVRDDCPSDQLHQHRTAAPPVIISFWASTAQGLTFHLFPPCFSFDGDSPKTFDRDGQER